MLEKVIRCAIVGVVLFIVYIVGQMILAALAAPAIATTLLIVVLLLIFGLYIVRAFGVTL